MTGPTPRTTRTEPPPPRPAALRRRARAAVARSAAGERSLAVLVGFGLLAAGTAVALLSAGVFGAARAGRPLLDPVVVGVIRAQPLGARGAAVAVGLLLVVLGLVGAARSLRPERRPDLDVDGGRPGTTIVVSAAAAGDAVAAQAATLAGVTRARARLVGSGRAPALRVTLWLADDADVREVLARLDDRVLTSVRSSLGLAVLPAAVRLELDASPPPPRVA